MQQGGVRVEKASSAILQVITVQSPKGSYDNLFLSNYITINLRDTLARLRGVGQVSMFGQQDYAMRIWLDPQRLAGFDLTPQEVIVAVRAQNVQAALGRIGSAPVISAQQHSVPLTTQGPAHHAALLGCAASAPMARLDQTARNFAAPFATANLDIIIARPQR